MQLYRLEHHGGSVFRGRAEDRDAEIFIKFEQI